MDRDSLPRDAAGPPQEPDDALASCLQRIAALEEAVAARDHFVAVVGHEMRNPMVPILLAVDRVRRLAAAGDLERLQQAVGTLDLAVAGFVRRATQVLDVSRFNAGQFRLDPRPTDLSALLADVAANYAAMARRAGCAVDVLAPPCLVVPCDREAVQQMTENLLSNALKYGAGGRVTLRLLHHGPGIRLAVSDRGPGIAPSDRARIFERFERVARHDSPGGFGIGLWLVGRLAAAMGAQITVEGGPGEGSTFIIDLPTQDQRRD